MKCKGCLGELVKDEKRGCFYCPVCHPPQEEIIPESEKSRDKYIDVPLTPEQESRIRNIVRDEIENWHIPKKVELAEIPIPELDKHVNWRSEAKELKIELYDKEAKKPRRKVDVVNDIELKIKELINGKDKDKSESEEKDSADNGDRNTSEDGEDTGS